MNARISLSILLLASALGSLPSCSDDDEAKTHDPGTAGDANSGGDSGAANGAASGAGGTASGEAGSGGTGAGANGGASATGGTGGGSGGETVGNPMCAPGVSDGEPCDGDDNCLNAQSEFCLCNSMSEWRCGNI